jgi:hypothetical protein
MVMDPGEIEEIRRSLQKIAENTDRIAESLAILSECVDKEGRLKVVDARKDEITIKED